MQGETVTTKGHIIGRDGRTYLKDRDSGASIELLFRRGTQVSCGKYTGPGGHGNGKYYVTGKVCRSLMPGRGADRMIWALALFILSGLLGFVLLGIRGITNDAWIPVVELGLVGGDWMLVPLFTGLFGLPTLLLSLSTDPAIPKQDEGLVESMTRSRKVRGMLAGTMTGAFVGWFPGITSAEAGVLVAQATPARDEDLARPDDGEKAGPDTEEFIVSISAINTANAISNFVALFVIFKTRSGAARAAQEIIGIMLQPWVRPLHPPWQLSLILIALLISGVLAYYSTLFLGKAFSRGFQRISYRSLVLAIMVFLVVLVVLFSGPFGVLIMVIATFVGLIPPTIGVKRVHLMGCLILPLFINWLDIPLPGGGFL
jgi:putative membrane protein